MKLSSVLKYTAGLGLGAALLYITFRNINLQEALAQLQKADYLWVSVSLAIALLSHLFRAIRWRMLMEPAGYLPNTWNTFAAVMVGYMANNAIPRLGEVSRCTLLTRSDSIPFQVSIGTVVLERLMDMLVMVGFLAVAFFLEFDRLVQIVEQLTGQDAASAATARIGWLFALAMVFLLGFILLRKYRHQLLAHPWIRKGIDFLLPLFRSLTSITRIRSPFLFLLLTAGIWVGYISIYYTAFLTLPETEGLSIYFGMMIMIIGGISVVLPVPGGVGAFHFLAQLGFIAFGYSETAAVSYALLVHTTQYLIVLIVGALCYISLLLRPVRNAALPDPVAD